MRRSGGCGQNWCCRRCERRLRWISGATGWNSARISPIPLFLNDFLTRALLLCPLDRFTVHNYTNVHTGRMSQTSIERLRDYLAQLPPQAQALLMREFERAIERGEDTTVATFVLEQLRKVVRGSDEEVRPRTDDPPRVVVAGVAMADPRRRARSGARIRSGAGPGAGNRNRVRARVRDPQISARRSGCDLQDCHARARRRQAA